MPTIKANEKQLSALKDIENALKIVSDINAIFSTHSDVCVSCKEGKGRATKEYSVVLDDGTKKRVLTALNAVKDRLGKDAMAKAARYNVSLSDDELAIFAACGENTNTEPEGETDTAASLMRKRQPMQGRRMPHRMAVPIPAASPLRAITDTHKYTKTAPQASVCGA